MTYTQHRIWLSDTNWVWRLLLLFPIGRYRLYRWLNLHSCIQINAPNSHFLCFLLKVKWTIFSPGERYFCNNKYEQHMNFVLATFILPVGKFSQLRFNDVYDVENERKSISLEFYQEFFCSRQLLIRQLKCHRKRSLDILPVCLLFCLTSENQMKL